MSNAQAQPKSKTNKAWFARPIARGRLTSRSSAVDARQVVPAPAPNPYLVAERRQQTNYRTVVTPAQPHTSTTCYRCNAVMLPHADVCTSCCAPSADHAPVPVRTTTAPRWEIAEPVAGTTADETTSPVLASWPFGAAEAEPTKSAAALITLSSVPTQRTQSSVPTQRTQEHSVPSVGPNPFLAAARIQHAREAIEAL